MSGFDKLERIMEASIAHPDVMFCVEKDHLRVDYRLGPRRVGKLVSWDVLETSIVNPAIKAAEACKWALNDPYA